MDLIESSAGEPASLMGSNELTRTTAYILVLPIFGVVLELRIRRVNVLASGAGYESGIVSNALRV